MGLKVELTLLSCSLTHPVTPHVLVQNEQPPKHDKESGVNACMMS
jgi:hypothetical protein